MSGQTGNESSALDPGRIESILRALENPNYDWRTVPGIARETGLSADQVETVLGQIVESIVRTWDEHARPLFTTRKHYDQNQSLGRKLLSAIADTVT